MSRAPVSMVVVATFLLVAADRAHAATPVDPANGCGQEITAPGEYVLTGDLACSTESSGIVISASGVKLRLAGHTISSEICDLSQNLSGIVVSGGFTDVEIEGGTVTGFNDGILLYSSESRVRGMTVTGACAFGIVVSGADNRLYTNVVVANGIDGVVLDRAAGTIFSSNDIGGNARNGVTITDFSDSNVIDQNIVHNNGLVEGHGVAIYNGTGNTIRNNAVNGNFDGIGLMSPGNTAEANTVNASVSVGISISGAGAASVVRQNTALRSGIVDLSDAIPGCGPNTWTGNAFETDQAGGAADGGPAAGCIN